MDLIKQMGLFPKTEQELGMEREQHFLEEVFPRLREAAKSRNAKPEDVTSEILSQYSSIKFRSSLICKIKLRGKKWHITIPDRLQESIPKGTKTSTIKSEQKMSRIAFNSMTQDEIVALLEKATILAIELVPKEFDCCSRFKECSDAKVCTHPDPSFSMLCGYRKIIKSGRFFYGVNRNID
jgi:hypothetical protein